MSGSLGVSPRKFCDHSVAQAWVPEAESARVLLEKAVVFPPRVSSGGQVHERRGQAGAHPRPGGASHLQGWGPQTGIHTGSRQQRQSGQIRAQMRQRKHLSGGGSPGAPRRGAAVRGGVAEQDTQLASQGRPPAGVMRARGGEEDRPPQRRALGGRVETSCRETSASSTGSTGTSAAGLPAVSDCRAETARERRGHASTLKGTTPPGLIGNQGFAVSSPRARRRASVTRPSTASQDSGQQVPRCLSAHAGTPAWPPEHTHTHTQHTTHTPIHTHTIQSTHHTHT